MKKLLENLSIPKQPGVYIMRGEGGKVIYVGKAKNLNNRIRSYFNNSIKDEKTSQLVRKIERFEFIITLNEVEALILEARLVKQYKPQYNILLKDNQPYMYIKLTQEEYPVLQCTRMIENDGAKYFGPFVYGRARQHLFVLTARLFGLRVGKIISKGDREVQKLLSAVHQDNFQKFTKTEYASNVRMAELFLGGKRNKLVNYLEQKMKMAAKTKNYELAKICRDQCISIRRLQEKQLVSLPKKYDQDIISYCLQAEQMMIQVFKVNKGVISNKDDYQLKFINKEATFLNFLQQYYLINVIPKEVIIAKTLTFTKSQIKLISNYLSKIKGQIVKITQPNRGDKVKLLQLVEQNLLAKASNQAGKQLQAYLHLESLPQLIDGFDISNISGKYAVGSCVRFKNCKPDKEMYRRFKIKYISGPNDFAMMYEVIKRRYLHQEWGLPDLILVDGGKGQLAFAKRVLDALQLEIPLISLAKREEEVFIVGSSQPVIMSKNSKGLKLLQQVRDEAHRFAIIYHKKLRKKI